VVITALLDSGKLQGFSKVVRDITRRKGAEDSVRELSSRLLQLRDEERRNIARELHDSAGQMIAAVNMNLASLGENGSCTPEALEVIKQSLDLLQQLSTEIRTISHLLHPPLLDEVGLSSALHLYVQGFSERSKIHVDFDITSDFGRLSRELETCIFRLVQESLTNIHRHSGSKTAKIRIWRGGAEVYVQVQDSGRGFCAGSDVEVNTMAGVGIRGMQERVRQLGGNFEILAGAEGIGTIISIRLLAENPAAL
jgi:signal transduction histidine kinase